jgi:hypothetical protein
MFQRKISGFELAHLLKMCEARFSRKMTGKTDFAPHEKTRIAEALQLDPAWLFAETHIPPAARFRERAMLTPGMETR